MLRLETARLHLDFLDKVGLELLPTPPFGDVRDVDAVDHVDVLAIAGAVDLVSAEARSRSRRATLQRLKPRARRQRNQRLERPALRNVVHHFLGDRDGHLALCDVDQRCFAGHLHRLRHRADFQADVERGMRPTARSRPPDREVRNPFAVTVIVYIPGGRAAMRYAPASSVCTFRVPKRRPRKLLPSLRRLFRR